MTAALGGAANVKLAEAASETLLRVTLADATRLDPKALAAAGVKGVQQLGDGLVHLIVGLNAEQYATEMKGAMAV